MGTRNTARIHLLTAKEAPIVAIIRRKPSKCFHVMKWNTETDSIEHGSWFSGKLYATCSNVSFDGEWMLYLATGARGDIWTGICRLPWLKTCWHEDVGTAYQGGGYWLNRDEVRIIVGRSPDLRQYGVPFDAVKARTKDADVYLGFCFHGAGWKRAGPLETYPNPKRPKQPHIDWKNDPGWELRPTPKHPTLRVFYRFPVNPERDYEFSLDGYPDIVGPHVDWAAYDGAGRLVLSRDGGVEKYTLEDLRRGCPSFATSFEDLEPPREAVSV